MKPSFFVLLFVYTLGVYAQSVLKGTTRSGDVPLPFTTIYVKGTTNGTVSNSEGQYTLPLKPGKYTIVAQHVGYKTAEIEIRVSNENRLQQLDFNLSEQALQLKTVVVTPNDEDPAYRIIREAIRKRKFYQNEVKAFKCETYLKGLQRLDERPDRFLGIKITIDTGIVYLSESVSELSFEQPDNYYEKMISSKVSGDDQGFSFNQATDFNLNLYQKNFDFDGLMERALISPISSQAFFFYDFEWLGSFMENGRLVNKIKLLPKRASDPVFDGIIYIVEDSWRIHTVDLLLTQNRGIEFVDSLKIIQTLAPVENNIWMPISQRFSFLFKILGFKGSGYFIGVYSNYQVEPNYALIEEEGDSSIVASEKVDLFTDQDFGQEVFLVEEGSNKKDSAYWDKIRPIPLTGIETKDYFEKDSIREVKESPAYKDSVDREQNKVTVGNIFLSGYAKSNSLGEKYWVIPPLPSLVQFNTVEGLVLDMQPTYWKQEDNRTKFSVSPSVRYGFSSEKFYGKLEASLRKLDKKFTRFEAGGGHYVAQFDERGAITPLINTWTTLNGNNFMKLFQKSFVYGRFEQEIKNGIRFVGEIEYAVRDTLPNTNLDYYWAPTEEVNFTPNKPKNEELNDQTGFDTNHALIVKLNFRIRFDQKYASRPDRRIIYSSKYPELNILYKKGVKTIGSDIDFDFVKLSVSDEFRIGLAGTSNYVFTSGTFLRNPSIIFVDFTHFSGNETSFSRLNNKDRFQLLPYYQFSTTKVYFSGNYEHHFNEFILNKIPLVRKLNFQAVIAANYLRSQIVGHYFEFGIGIEHIFKILRVDYWWALRNGHFSGNGIRLGVGF